MDGKLSESQERGYYLQSLQDLLHHICQSRIIITLTERGECNKVHVAFGAGFGDNDSQ